MKNNIDNLIYIFSIIGHYVYIKQVWKVDNLMMNTKIGFKRGELMNYPVNDASLIYLLMNRSAQSGYTHYIHEVCINY